MPRENAYPHSCSHSWLPLPEASRYALDKEHTEARVPGPGVSTH